MNYHETDAEQERNEDVDFDMRRDGVHNAVPGEDVIKAQIWMYSDTANEFQYNDTHYSFDSTCWRLASLTQAQQRQPYTLHIASLAGPEGEWQGGHTPTAKVLGLLQKECYCWDHTGGPNERKGRVTPFTGDITVSNPNVPLMCWIQSHVSPLAPLR